MTKQQLITDIESVIDRHKESQTLPVIAQGDPEEHDQKAPKSARPVRFTAIIGHTQRSQGAVSPAIGSEWSFWKPRIEGPLKRACDDIGIDLQIIEYPKTRAGISTRINLVRGEVNDFNPDLILDFHFNSSPNPRANGSEVLYSRGSVLGQAFATKVLDCAIDCFDLKPRGVKPRGPDERGGPITHAFRAPTGISEPGFGSNPNDAAALERHADEFMAILPKDIQCFAVENGLVPAA